MSSNDSATWRTILSRVLLIVFVLSLIGSTVAIWADIRIQTGDEWTRTVAPLADDPAIQQFVVDRAMNLIDQQFAADENAGRLETFTRNQTLSLARGYLEDFVTSPRFSAFWITANQNAHTLAMRRASPQEGDILRHDEGVVALDFQPMVDYANTQLQGIVPLIGDRNIIQIDDPTVVLYSADWLATTTNVVREIRTWAVVLPIIATISLLSTLALATDRIRMLKVLGVSVAIGAALSLVAFYIWRSWFVGQRSTIDAPALDAVLRIITTDLVNALRGWVIAGAALGSAVMISQSRFAHDPRVQSMVAQHRQSIILGAIGIAMLVLIFVDFPSLWISVPILLVILTGLFLLFTGRQGDSAEVPAP